MRLMQLPAHITEMMQELKAVVLIRQKNIMNET